MQRIVAGELRGRRLMSLPARANDVRPTSARVRTAIFDRLQREVLDARVLDLFAGSGALGIEALSRGAAHATLVEADPGVVRFLRRQLAGLSLGERTRVWEGDARIFVRRAAADQFDLVLIDPPWEERDLYVEVAAELARGACLAVGGVLVAVHRRQRGAVDWPSPWAVEAVRRHGDAVVDFLRLEVGHEQ